MICPDREPELNALIDGELDPDRARALGLHLRTCPDCAEALAGLVALRGELAALAPPAPAGLAARVAAELAASSAPAASAARAARRDWSRPRWAAGWSLGGIAVGIAAAVALIVLSGLLAPGGEQRANLAAVADADRRVALAAPPSAALAGEAARAWLRAAGLPAPPVPETLGAGFRLMELRADVVQGHPAGVLLYRRGAEAVALIVWRPHPGEPTRPSRAARSRGREVVYWSTERAEFWAVGRRAGAVRDFVASYRAGL